MIRNTLCMLALYLCLCHAAGALGAATPLRTYRDTDPSTGKSVECDSCPPGKYMRTRCTETLKSDCATCPNGTYTEVWNYIKKCLRCSVCGHNQVIKTQCTQENDCECECMGGFYNKYDICLRHSECQAGHEVLHAGTPDADTVCQTCPNGTFSNVVSAQKKCLAHRDCGAEGLELLLRGSAWHDSVCVSCGDVKDVGDYLREIIPSFFTHQRMPPRRLRKILRKMPSANGRRHEGISSLNVPDLHKEINAWVASATAPQIRQLPVVLARIGADSAGERLQNKLSRMDSHLPVLCGAH